MAKIHVRPADGPQIRGFEHAAQYPRAFVRHSGEGQGRGESGSSTTIPTRDSTPKADRSATGLSKGSPAAMNVERRIG